MQRTGSACCLFSELSSETRARQVRVQLRAPGACGNTEAAVLDEREFEQALAWFANEVGPAALEALRQAFERDNGVVSGNDADFEPRMAHFWEGVMCEDAGQGAPIARYAEAHTELPSTLAACAGWLRSHRALFEVTARSAHALHLRDVCLGGAYVCGVSPREAELLEGDRFDARLVVRAGTLWLSPGRVFYPLGTRDALDALLTHVPRGSLTHGVLLDALLRMRGSYLRFESMKAEHVFRVEALHAAPSSAAWAIKPAPHP